MKPVWSFLTSIALAFILLVNQASPLYAMSGVIQAITEPQVNLSTPFNWGSAPAQIPAAVKMGTVMIGIKPGQLVLSQNNVAKMGNSSLTSALLQSGIQDFEPVFRSAVPPLIAAAQRKQDSLDGVQVYRLRLKPGVDMRDAIQVLSLHPAVAYAEPDYQANLITTPSDVLFPEQWGLNRIAAPDAWDKTTGKPEVIIAVVDSGIDIDHPDLAGQLWTNPGEVAGNGIDDDNNGKIDDIHGWNFVGDPTDLSDNTGHGTQVAGIIAAASDNQMGIAGLCWKCQLMIVKVTQAGGVTNYSDIAAGVVYAAQKGAKVINLSLGGYSDSATLRAAVATASKTAVVVGGAGNENLSLPFYPAAYNEYVVAVAGTNQTDAKVSTSNYGPWVDVSAPGEAITTTFIDGVYGASSGTSAAAPFASGLAGLLWSQHPDWPASQIRAHLLMTAENIDTAHPEYAGQLGYGRIHAGQAVSLPASPVLSVASILVNGAMGTTPAPGDAVTLDINLQNDWGAAAQLSGTLSSTDPYVEITNGSSAFENIATYQSGASLTPFQFRVLPNAPYGHTITFKLVVNSAVDGYEKELALQVNTLSETQQVGGPIEQDAVWEKDKTYHIIDNVLVSPGITLTIQPGTVMKFAPGKSLLINGTLLADGAPEEPILFTSDQPEPGPGSWNLLKFGEETADAVIDAQNEYITGSILRHARVEYATGVALMEAIPYISHVTFYRNAGTNEGEAYWFKPPGALWRKASTNRPGRLVVRDSIFLENQGTGFETYTIYHGGSSYEITRNQFINNGGIGISLDIDDSAARITSNYLSGNSGGIFLGMAGDIAGNILIEGNTILNSTAGAYFSGYGISMDSGRPIIRHNLFAHHNSSGASCQQACSVIFIHDHASPEVVENTFVYNKTDTLICFNCQYGYAQDTPKVFMNNNWANNEVNYIFQRGVKSSQDIDATSNYWGTTSTTEINQLIYDYYDDLNPGKVLYQPVLSAPSPQAPAFLLKAEATPETAGIEPVSIRLTFSAPMDQSKDPLATFGVEQPYNAFSVLADGQWLSETEWSGSVDITSLVPRGTHMLNVSGARGQDGMEIPTDTRFSFIVDYASSVTDQTPPPAPFVAASGVQESPSVVMIRWSSTDPDSSITHYRYAIGSARGANDIISWTVIEKNITEVRRTGLNLTAGQQYWVMVQARNAGGLWSSSSYSAFTAGQQSPKVYLPLLQK